ncbi:alpha/beta hydrolase [Aliiroseovarius sp. PTFE2010]|uniref:alpha/beta hydrolase n=1 Tax=Aliiroseovarius sp. PTFE2010 TaxID=3417190 RepID=UPI003CEAB7FF
MVFPEYASRDNSNVFIGTTRQVLGGVVIPGGRNETTTFHRLTLSVPTNPDLGQIAWPRRNQPVDPSQQYVFTGLHDFPSNSAFRSALSSELADRPKGKREVVIYVHGFNNSFSDGVLRLAQLDRDFGFDGVAVHYSWPSAAKPLAYEHDRQAALFSRDGLEALIEEVVAAEPESVTIMAHSMGAILAMEALRQIAIANPGRVDDVVDGVVLISPDLDVDVFRMQAARIGDLPKSFAIFVSDKDRALHLSALLSGKGQRLGNINEIERISDLSITVVNVTAFSEGLGHFAVGQSPALIKMLRNVGAIEAAFRTDRSGRTGLLPGAVLTVRNATQLILNPVAGLQ